MESTVNTAANCCNHPAAHSHLVCPHIFQRQSLEGIKCFTGEGWQLEYYCKSCAEEKKPLTDRFCDNCIEKLEEEGDWIVEGSPGIIENLRPFHFTSRSIPLSDSCPQQIIIIQPLHDHPVDAIILGQGGELCQVNLQDGSVQLITTLTKDQLRLDGAVSMVLSRDNTFIAITSASCNQQQAPFNYGVVIDLNTGQQVIPLNCGDYHVELTPFPVNFIEHAGEQFVIHATDWCRLDVTNLKTCECLTEREFTAGEDDEEDPFEESVFTEWYGQLLISPDQQKIATIGWIWHPVGVAFSWSLKDWLEKNIWEADYGKSKRSYCIWDYFWDSPFFWYDDNTLCIWGSSEYQRSCDLPIDSVVIIDAESEEVIREFAGPTSDIFYFDRYLFSGIPEKDGISVWDLEKGALLHKQPGINPRAYHPGLREFVEISENGWYAWHWQEEG
jgi:hypothetical protein